MNSKARRNALIALALAGFFGHGPASADKPGRSGDREHEARHSDRREEYREHRDSRFNDDHRRAVHDYYGRRFNAGKCPPGLAKKHNGCLPPGQARKWSRGYPLPHDVVYYRVPRELLIYLPPPPAHHRYVRIASDILLIAIGTGMVVDAIEDLTY
jgi:Ni/Co efflux regulator RcnB